MDVPSLDPPRDTAALDRHALVLPMWLSFGLVALALFGYGFGAGGAPAILAAFGVLIAVFLGHVIVNAVTGSAFTPGELALGLILYVAGLIGFGLARLVAPEPAARLFLPASLGFVALGAAVILYMVIHYGVRRSFEAFDVIREFRPAEHEPRRFRQHGP